MDHKDEIDEICQKFFIDLDIKCSETIWQMDKVSENALEFIDELFEIYERVGLIKKNRTNILDQMVYENQQMGMYDKDIDNPLIK